MHVTMPSFLCGFWGFKLSCLCFCIASALTHSPALLHIFVKDLHKNTEDIPVKSADGGKPGLLTNSEGSRVEG